MKYAEKRDLLAAVRQAVHDELTEMLRSEIREAVREEMDKAVPDVISFERVMADYGIGKSTLYKVWERIGGMKAGGKIVFSRKKIERIINEGKFPKARKS